MATNWRTIETSGSIGEDRQLRLDQPLPVAGPARVRVLVMVAEPAEEEWRQAVAGNPAFGFLKAPEDVYSLTDGKPFHDAG